MRWREQPDATKGQELRKVVRSNTQPGVRQQRVKLATWSGRVYSVAAVAEKYRGPNVGGLGINYVK